MKISVFGTGYVGLVSGLCFTENNNDVIFVDIDRKKIEQVARGEIPIYEPGLEEILARARERKLFSITSDAATAVQGSDISFICVGTPMREDKSINLEHVMSVARDIGEAIKEKDAYHVVVVKSTVVPTTTRDVVVPILEQYSGKRLGDGFGICMNPEFLREGCAVNDFRDPDRIVIGAENEKDFAILSMLYEQYHVPIVKTNTQTAEMIKYASNAVLSTLISFSNEMSNICSLVDGVDQQEVLNAVKLDKRWTPTVDGEKVRPGILVYLAGGPGFGGSCFPKDVNALLGFSHARDYPAPLLTAVMDINDAQPALVVQGLKQKLDTLQDKRIAVLGLAFKEDTDDIRESPAITLVRSLVQERARVAAHDPMAVEHFKKLFDVEYTDARSCLTGADACVVVTKWAEYKQLQPADFTTLMRRPLVFDARRIYDRDRFRAAGVEYLSVGLR